MTTATLVNIPARVLKAALTHAPKKDMRYYLVGVLVNTTTGELVSTDGHALFLAHIAPADCKPFIIPRDALEKALKGIPARAMIDAEILVTVTERDDEPDRGLALSSPATGVTIAATEVDGRFPDYSRIIPRETSGEAGQISPALLSRAADALALIAPCRDVLRELRLDHNGVSSPSVMHCGPDVPALVVIMPYRANHERGAWPVNPNTPSTNQAEAA
jgi:DNA polymerase-3 subunit beta